MIDHLTPEIDAYQQRFVDNVAGVIATSFYSSRPDIRILDTGCDTSGRQMAHLARLTRGEVVGINIPGDFPSTEASRIAGSQVSLQNMNGLDLQFEDHSFDMVISANVMEHVSDPVKYITECARVVKPNGIAYFETAPIWTSARGHHIHEDMVLENCPGESNYRNDGSLIPDWSHLTMTRNELFDVIAPKLQPQTCDYILWYLYESNDVNKTPWSTINTALRETFADVKVHTWDVKMPEASRKPKNTGEDHSVFGFAATLRKKKMNGIRRRLIWRLRRLGL
jgi:SAM-dependent methyltransferase